MFIEVCISACPYAYCCFSDMLRQPLDTDYTSFHFQYVTYHTAVF